MDADTFEHIEYTPPPARLEQESVIVTVGVLQAAETRIRELEEHIRTERHRFHQAIIKLANINGDLEDRVCTLEEMLRLSENLRQAEGGRDEI